MEWGSVVEWVQFGFGVLTSTLLLGFLIWWVLTVTRRSGDFLSGVLGSGTATLKDGRPSLQSMLCRHRILARVRNSYGREYTACTRCGLDINRGKEAHQWR